MTSVLVNDVLQAAKTIDPNALAVQVAEAAISTAANPSPESILADMELAIQLVKEFKAKMAGLHPSVQNIIKALF